MNSAGLCLFCSYDENGQLFRFTSRLGVSNLYYSIYWSKQRFVLARKTVSQRDLKLEKLESVMHVRLSHIHYINLLLAGNRPNPSVRNSVGTDEKIHEKPISDNKIPCNDTSTKSNNSMEQSDFANKIQDLTNEVRCLKQLFTTKEVILFNFEFRYIWK